MDIIKHIHKVQQMYDDYDVRGEPITKRTMMRASKKKGGRIKDPTFTKYKNGGNVPPRPDLENGHSNWTTDDWLQIIDPQGWMSDEDNNPIKKSGLLEYELADEYWQEQYEKYLKNGGTLDFKNYMELELNKKVSENINKNIRDKKRVEGLASILNLSPDRI